MFQLSALLDAVRGPAMANHILARVIQDGREIYVTNRSARRNACKECVLNQKSTIEPHWCLCINVSVIRAGLGPPALFVCILKIKCHWCIENVFENSCLCRWLFGWAGDMHHSWRLWLHAAVEWDSVQCLQSWLDWCWLLHTWVSIAHAVFLVICLFGSDMLGWMPRIVSGTWRVLLRSRAEWTPLQCN